MRLNMTQLLLVIASLFAAIQAVGNTPGPSVLTFTFDDCYSDHFDGSNQDYTEHVATITNNSVVNLNPMPDHVYRLVPLLNPHSCTPGLNNTNALCVSFDPFCNYLPGTKEAVRFDITLEPLVNEPVRIETLHFSQQAPTMFNWVNGTTATNNYPTRYSLRVLKNEQVIHESTDLFTARSWQLENFDFTSNPAFTVETATEFSFELTAYCPVGVPGFESIWDLEDLTITANCIDCIPPLDGGQILLDSGEAAVTSCIGQTHFSVSAVTAAQPGAYDYLLFDPAHNLAAHSQTGQFDLSTLAPGIYHVNGYHNPNNEILDQLIGEPFTFFSSSLCSQISSNSISVYINAPQGGSLTSDPITFCIGDGISDFISTGTIGLSGASGTTQQWIITDQTGDLILALPQSVEEVDFESLNVAPVRIYNMIYDGWLEGLAVSNLISNITGIAGPSPSSAATSPCFELSNFIEVTNTEFTPSIISGGPIELCVAEGLVSTLDTTDITLTPGSGQKNTWVVTDEAGIEIININDNLSSINFESSHQNSCLLWNLTYDDALTNLAIGNSFLELGGCATKSNSINITKNRNIGGTIMGGPFEFCINDDLADYIPLDSISLSGAEGNNSQWVIVDKDGIVVDLPVSFDQYNFDLDTIKDLFLLHMSYNGIITNLERGWPVTEIISCFSLSNQILISRNLCPYEGGTLTGGPYNFCTNDGQPDYITDLQLAGEVGLSSQWVITDNNDKVVALPNQISDYDFESSGSGRCLVYNLSSAGDLPDLIIDTNLSDISGQFSLSNPINVTKFAPVGGTLSGPAYAFCIGDGEEDKIDPNDLNLEGQIGQNAIWLLTSVSDEAIIAMTEQINDLNFENLATSDLNLWYLTYDSGITGLQMGQPLSGIQGCTALSNNLPIEINIVAGGELSSSNTFIQFCVNDGEPDFIEPGSITLSNEQGDLHEWALTNTSGTEILALPDSPYDIDFDSFGSGTCVLWNVSTLGASSLQIGGSIVALAECAATSNFLSIFRYDNDGGLLSGGPFTYCVGDNVEDRIPAGAITLTDNVGGNSQWVITDGDGIMTDLPLTDYSEINFDTEASGTSFVYHMSYDGPLGGLGDNLPLSDVTGCYTLSNRIEITKQDCPTPFTGLIISNINANDQVELTNTGDNFIDLKEIWLHTFDLQYQASSLAYSCSDDLILEAGESITLQLEIDIDPTQGELLLSAIDDSTQAKYTLQYVQWGAGHQGLAEMAEAQGLWAAEVYVPAFGEEMSIGYYLSEGQGLWIEEEMANCLTSIENTNPGLDVTFYPNPTSSLLNIKMPNLNTTSIEVRIIDKLGQKVYSKKITEKVDHQLDVSTFTEGLYLLQIKQGDKSYIKSFIKI